MGGGGEGEMGRGRGQGKKRWRGENLKEAGSGGNRGERGEREGARAGDWGIRKAGLAEVGDEKGAKVREGG